MKFNLAGSIGLFCSLLAGCQSIPIRLDPVSIQDESRIATISIIGNRFTCSKIGLLASFNEYSSGEIVGFNVDETIESVINKKFLNLTGANPVTAEINKTQLEKIYTPADFIFPDDWKLISSRISELQEEYNLDYISLIVKLDSPDFIYGTHERLNSIGCVSRSESDSIKLFFSAHLFVFKRGVQEPVAESFIRRYGETPFSVASLSNSEGDADMESEFNAFLINVIDYESDVLFGKKKWTRVDTPFIAQ